MTQTNHCMRVQCLLTMYGVDQESPNDVECEYADMVALHKRHYGLAMAIDHIWLLWVWSAYRITARVAPHRLQVSSSGATSKRWFNGWWLYPWVIKSRLCPAIYEIDQGSAIRAVYRVVHPEFETVNIQMGSLLRELLTAKWFWGGRF